MDENPGKLEKEVTIESDQRKSHICIEIRNKFQKPSLVLL